MYDAEAREFLELVVNWCDLCLPANEQAFAEAHRIKIQDFQVIISDTKQAMEGVNEDEKKGGV